MSSGFKSQEITETGQRKLVLENSEHELLSRTVSGSEVSYQWSMAMPFDASYRAVNAAVELFGRPRPFKSGMYANLDSPNTTTRAMNDLVIEKAGQQGASATGSSRISAFRLVYSTFSLFWASREYQEEKHLPRMTFTGKSNAGVQSLAERAIRFSASDGVYESIDELLAQLNPSEN